MKKPLAIGIGIVLLVMLLLFSMTYNVSFYEVAVKRTFGQATEESIVTEPGLRFKLPIFADQVTKFDKRLQLQETALETVPTADGQQVMARAFLLWQVDEDGDGPLRFDRAYQSIERANQQIQDRLKTAMTAGLSRYEFSDLLGPHSRLGDVEEAIFEELRGLRDNGIKPRSVGISNLLLPPRTTQAVLSRMEATREALADNERRRGNAEAHRIQSEARTAADKIRAFANRRAQEIRAAGDREAARYIQQMGEEEQLALFLLYLDTLRESLTDHTTFVLETDMAPWHLMDMRAATDANGIPQPERAFAGVDGPIRIVTNPKDDHAYDDNGENDAVEDTKESQSTSTGSDSTAPSDDTTDDG